VSTVLKNIALLQSVALRFVINSLYSTVHASTQKYNLTFVHM